METKIERRPLDGREPAVSEDDRRRENISSEAERRQTEQDRMTPQRRKKTPSASDPGHTA
ncbi:hypothetical protein [Rhodopseudomonas sp. B29]|uniref:hypothetical protein n=1 Tax=Rhodopseudomonas sp. B29 TaxID=95607 RepID=UPI000347C96A|nr:hypothetical protein [Rhodopseudomonas sp. B29]